VFITNTELSLLTSQVLKFKLKITGDQEL